MKRFFLPLTVLWLCSTARAAKTATPAFDVKAHSLLKRVFDRYRALHSYSGTMRWARSGDALDSFEQNINKGQTQVRVAQPKVCLISRIERSQFGQRYVDDGKDFYINVLPDDVLRISHDSLEQDEIWKFAHATDFGLKALLQDRNPLQAYGSYVKGISFAPSTQKGQADIVVRLEAPKAKAQIHYIVGNQGRLLYAVRIHQVVNGKTLNENEELFDQKFDPPIPATELEPDANMKRLAEEGRKPKTDTKTPRD